MALPRVDEGTEAVNDDPNLWLEDVNGDAALRWVRERNTETAKELETGAAFKTLEADLLTIMDSEAKIPFVTKNGAHYYNFWRDAEHVRGLWRRTSLDEYRKANPQWEPVLDIDALATSEGENWVFQGAQFLRPEYQRCLISLSRGGADATVTREFDVIDKAFVADGFQLPEAKGGAGWIDRDTVFVSTDFGPGSMTTSGYPRIAKRWTRGTPLSEATTVFAARESDMIAGAFHDATQGFERDFIVRATSFFSSEMYLLGKDASLRRIEVQNDAECSVNREWLLVKLRSPWVVSGRAHAAGSLLATRFDLFMDGKPEFVVVFAPTATTSLAGYNWTRHHLILDVLDDVKNRLYVLTPNSAGTRDEWSLRPLAGAPTIGTVSAWGVEPDDSDDVFQTVTDFLTPTTLNHGAIGKPLTTLKTSPAFFDASGLEIGQHFTTSKDGTRIPYFEVSRAGLVLDGSHKTLLTGYGGFEISQVPYYSGGVGRAWLTRGGVYVVANIRGGGEYGPQWHQAALKQNRLRAFEDFAAVAQDLVARNVTSVKHLGVEGGSNGGLLVGNMITLYPQLMGAAVCQVPLLDMKRYSKLLAGASWVAEYGDPDLPAEWEFLQTFSPYQNVKAGMPYPPVLFMTSTRDDRVHPGHARKMAARMLGLGYDVRYFENIEGGHGGAADNKQAAHMGALAYTFLWEKLT